MKNLKLSVKIDKIIQMNNRDSEKAMNMTDSLCDKLKSSDIV